MHPRSCFLVFLLAASVSFSELATTIRAAEKPKVPRISIDEFDKKRQEKDTVVLDVRTPEEFTAGHVPGATNIDLQNPDFHKNVAKLDKSKTYLIHCGSGVRSGRASRMMSTMGFENLFDFSGGFNKWKNEHKPIEKGPAHRDDPPAH